MRTRMLCAALAAIWGATAWTDGVLGAIEPIDLTVVQNQPVDLYFPNEFDLVHPKLLTFEGQLTNPTQVSGSLSVIFDYLDLTGGETLLPAVTLPAPALASTPFLVEAILPFCPPQVSLHLRLADTDVLQVNGTFTHDCIVPEPAMFSVFGLGMLGVVGLVSYRRARKVMGRLS